MGLQELLGKEQRKKKKPTKIQYVIIKILGLSSFVSTCEKLYMN